MRPQQQGRRQRNRNNGGNNRRGQNPLSRNYESNGPDVKIRGNAQLIADKYTTLARDAHASGDSVMAENYLQHAEHYNRIIMAAQAQMQTQREERSQFDDQDDDDGDGDDYQEGAPQQYSQPQPQQQNDGNRSRDRDRDNGGNRDRDRDGGGNRDRDGGGNRDRNRDRGDRQRQQDVMNGEAQPNGHDAAEAPQPVIGETPVEVAMEEQEQAATPARRNTPRRPRNAPAEQAEGSAEASPEAGESVPAEV